ncbi:MAG: response regulator, partial [Saprospiraceae bacterium]|nr:response regulator [Saprospiraceae bacterium]
KVPSFLVTLGMLSVLSGVANQISRGQSILFMDGTLPDMNSLEAITAIREFDQEVKILVLEESGTAALPPERVKALNVEAVLPKDFSGQTMMRGIAEALRSPSVMDEKTANSRLLKETVLIVDDNEEIRKTLALFLKKKGYNVQSASSGEDALMKTKQEKPDVVFLDFRMPGMDGVMTLRHIKRFDESIKVVMLTSVQDEYIIAEASREGASDYLVKPCDLYKLETLLITLLSQR